MGVKRSKWFPRALIGGAAAIALLAVGCGSSSDGSSKPPGAGGSQNIAGNGGAGQPCAGGGCTSTPTPVPGDLTEVQACRTYFQTVCDRIRECDAPIFRPCESPIDVCPDILFADGSPWTIEQVVACTSTWTTHDCTALMTDQWPACSQVVGERALGDACVFDAQCQTGRCNEGIVSSYSASCGACADVVAPNAPCSKEHVCPENQYCYMGLCTDPAVPTNVDLCYDVECPEDQWCSQGECVAPLTVGQACTWNSKCEAGLGCEIALVEAEEMEPTTGTCQPLPAFGEACLPTFGRSGLCIDGGTCTARPTGDCVPLRLVGESCGFTICVHGAYCNVLNYSHVESYICHPRGDVGAVCDPNGSDQGHFGCAEGLRCACSDATCVSGACASARQAGESCDGTTQICAEGLGCQASICVDPDAPPAIIPAGSPCQRSTDFGREPSDCVEELECMCTTPACEQSLCATPRLLGESCDGSSNICRQSFVCEAGKCAELTGRDLEAQSCMPAP